MNNKKFEAVKVALSDDEKFSDKKLCDSTQTGTITNSNPSTASMAKHLLINEVCEITRKSRVTIWQWSKKGLLKPIGRSGKNPIYLEKDVLNFLYGSNVNLNPEI